MATSGTPSLVQTARERQRAVAAERHEAVELEEVDGAQRGGGQVVASALVGLAFRRQRCCGMCSGLLIDGLMREVCSIVPPKRSIERVLMRPRGMIHGGVVGGGLGDDVEQRGPAAAQADDLVAVVIEQPSDESLDRGVESGDVAAAGEDGDSFHGSWVSGLAVEGRLRSGHH